MNSDIRIDAHQHFWYYNRAEYDWIDESMLLLQKNFLPADLKIELDAQKMSGCVAVQARQTLEETLWLLSLAKQNPWIKGVVGWVDLRSKALLYQLDLLSEYRSLKGFRHVLQGELDPNFMLSRDFIAGIKEIASRGYCYDILVMQHQLPEVIKLVETLPVMPLVVDHIAKPVISCALSEAEKGSAQSKAVDQHNAAWDAWCSNMEALAQFDHVHCKLSGMVTEAEWQTWTPEQLWPYLEKVMDCFGPERVMFGSDWPVCQVAGRYSDVIDLVESFVDARFPEHKANIMGRNASQFYSL